MGGRKETDERKVFCMGREAVETLNIKGRAYGLIGSDESLSNCDVCWTCICFNRSSMECWYPETDCESRTDCPGDAESIDNPEWFRCAYWKIREE